MARKYHRFYHSANLTNGTGQVTDITLSPQSYFFMARPVYGSGGNDPVLGAWGMHRYDDWDALAAQSSDTPTLNANASGASWLLNFMYPEENAADFGGFYLFKRSGRLGIASRATSLSPEIRGVEVIEWPFG